ncbi:catalase [Bacillus testis]|uniref:catalase n=1 Tax=Bacillus testis TaxID=1622072 RepID=UPI00067EDBD7|nr:catalase [Bacillus testis]
MDKEQHYSSAGANKKNEQLDQHRVDDTGQKLTTNQGLRIADDEHSLKAGNRGPTLMEDFHFREKMTHFDHERIPERIVHARGYGAHGYFEAYESMKEYTCADFLSEAGKQTPVFVRFSTVAGSKGSADTVRDVRGFATKFYTDEGNFDLVGNNIPVFFIQDAIKFPDFVHSVKPEPHNEMPQAASAHDTFWDFMVRNTEAAHMLMWHMSDRAIPRSYRMMEGFGVHTFRFVNAEGKAHFVKFHWKPLLGTHSLVWDEAQKLAGKDPDFHRRDLWESIERGDYPQYEFGVQILPEEDENKFDFDILDPTKIWPEEIIPVKKIGKMTLNRNVDNVFAETEQAAFHIGHVVPGIDFTNDPLLQGRLFSYTDTQLIRLGGPNFHQLPINKSVAPVHNNQRDGYGQMNIHQGKTSYHNNGLNGNSPDTATPQEGAYVHYQEKVEGRKIQQRSASFDDHYSQAILFWNSMSLVEKEHIKQAFSFEVGKLTSKELQQEVVELIGRIDTELAKQVAVAIGAEPPKTTPAYKVTETSPALSMMNTTYSPKTLKVAILAHNGFHYKEVTDLINALKKEGVQYEIISENLGQIVSAEGPVLPVDQNLLTADSVVYDAIYVAGGKESAASLMKNKKAIVIVAEAYEHFKTVGAINEGLELVKAAGIQPLAPETTDTAEHMYNEAGLIFMQNAGSETSDFTRAFIEGVGKQRHWDRKQ